MVEQANRGANASLLHYFLYTKFHERALFSGSFILLDAPQQSNEIRSAWRCPNDHEKVERNSFGLALPQRSRVFSTRKRVHYGLVCCVSPTKHHPHIIPAANESVPLVHPSGCPPTVERNSFGLALPQRSRKSRTKFVRPGAAPTITSLFHPQTSSLWTRLLHFTHQAPSTYNSRSKRVCSARSPFWMPPNSRTKFVRPGAAPTITIRVWRVASRDSSRKWVLAGAWLHADGKPAHCRLSNFRNKQAAKAWVLQELGPA
ncbi:hypothetical protein F5050DRAFT_1811347 [Lentinula boryana]|uniref:Uncharacterized protein n=1 Tax=Lentinula boryana TaxID=40481 RepID=A0ABQ8Q217_9AGAR|nr:hypothetical protein F5050DRAFT_1811347 [Lentinula boryana]